MMPAEEVLRIVSLLEANGLAVWLDGGWGVDALAGRQTRPHQDLDLAIALAEAGAVIRLLAGLGYAVFEDEMPTRLDLRDAADRRVDLHPLTFDATGNGLQQLQDGTFGTYTAEGLTGQGTVGQRPVPCLSAALQLRFHTGYELDDNDRHDIALLEQLLATGGVDITADLVAGLIATQFPQWADLPLRPVASAGTVHALFRLGEDMLVRVPRVPTSSSDPIEGFLPRLAPFLPVPIPTLLGEGQPTHEYRGRWSVVRWLDGENPVEGQLASPSGLAADLARFVTALWKIGLAGGPAAYRGGPLAMLNAETVGAITDLRGIIDTDAATAIWDHAVHLPAWEGPDTWVHADLMPGNLLTSNGRLTAVIDFDTAGIGDPACDLIVAWMLLPAHVRRAFRRATGVDQATWLRGRAHAFSMALGHLPYYKDTNPVMADNARYTIREVLADHSGHLQ
jgi:aminoglycoside phosphotransferase (APT) family kinase protein